ncbi:hypothetical protein M378DRAFT_523691 [Amanita muscaria Koide BX008]|uniref:Uncharacterized protein n=1 Tax=Amanita muscaria (strain Koide BX008) TaxID=946122 RepID=A0A0C2WJP7_AMAMK|nr:hypothetical protein M378DRAFT_523691 [Amanita muscaria Koide BX008]
MIGSAWPGSSMRSGGEQRQVDQFGGGVLALESGRVGAAGNQFSNIAEAATVPEPINTARRSARETPAPLGQPPSQPAQPGHSTLLDVAQHLQQSDFQVPPAPAYNPQSVVPPPPEQSAFNTNYDYDSQWHGQQHQYPVLPSMAQQSVAQYPYQPQATAGHTQHYSPQPVTSPQQQPQRLQHTPPPQDLRLAKRQRLDGPNLNRQAHHHAPLPPQPQFQPFPFPAQNAGVYPDRSQGLSLRYGSYMVSGGEGSRTGQSGGVRAHGSGGNFGASIQVEGHNIIPNPAGRAAVSMATQLHGAHGISGNPWLTNIVGSNLTTVNNYGGTHGVSFSVFIDSLI